mmetsp:Transcript_38686/g.84146  ORF Transcript_38686/g.84146 Transcript_38686/m.84146 type:complete len:285 (-) Transcript_38686:1632-2486(-)
MSNSHYTRSPAHRSVPHCYGLRRQPCSRTSGPKKSYACRSVSRSSNQLLTPPVALPAGRPVRRPSSPTAAQSDGRPVSRSACSCARLAQATNPPHQMRAAWARFCTNWATVWRLSRGGARLAHAKKPPQVWAAWVKFCTTWATVWWVWSSFSLRVISVSMVKVVFLARAPQGNRSLHSARMSSSYGIQKSHSSRLTPSVGWDRLPSRSMICVLPRALESYLGQLGTPSALGSPFAPKLAQYLAVNTARLFAASEAFWFCSTNWNTKKVSVPWKEKGSNAWKLYW